MAIDLFGFRIGKKSKGEQETEALKQETFVAPDEYDGSYNFETGGVFGTYVDFSGAVKDENSALSMYRTMALYPEVDSAIEDIINEAVVIDEDRRPIRLDLDRVDISETIKKRIYDEFETILKLLDFGRKSHELFRRWYIDSKIYYHIIIDKTDPRKGIQDLRAIDPINIKKVKKVLRDKAPMGGAKVPMVKGMEEFYVYTNTDKKSMYQTPASGIKISPDSICYAHSGIIDANTKRVVGYLQKAIRPLNMLRQIEDAVVVYRISRAPERRIFYIDVGNLPKQKAEQYLRSLMNRYRSKLIYDQTTGEIRDDRRHMSMLEDYWLPRREGGRGTEISTLPGGQNLGEMTDVEYLLRKVYSALNVPLTRMMPQDGFNLGRSAEITRDEVTFFKFIERLRMKFSLMFLQLLRVQLVLKGIMTEEEWNTIQSDVFFVFAKDSHFNELKEAEILRNRIDMAASLEPLVGKYYSTRYIRKNILKQTEEEIRIIDTENMAELASQPQQMMPPDQGPGLIQ
tara:strand:- start:11279 stop:12817 length:1539 start_codon:yes stop_codon:yes gene_type:complete